MKGSFYFVHGTGVREAGYQASCDAIKDQLKGDPWKDVTFAACDWGQQLRGRFDDVSAALPEEQAAKGLDTHELSPAELNLAMWELLTDDPLIELRLVGEQAPEEQEPPIGGGPVSDVADAMSTLQGAAIDLSGTGIDAAQLSNAVQQVQNSSEIAVAAGVVGSLDADLAEAIARATVAQILASHLTDQPGTAPAIAVSGACRDALVAEITRALQPDVAKGAIDGWIKKKLVSVGERLGTSMLLGRRASGTAASMDGVGDVLSYQRHGEEVRKLVTQGLSGLPKPIVAVGHSLGGIILVDILSGSSAVKVDLLVTVGSQSPVLYLIDALGDLRPPDHAGFSIPSPWLNIFNRYDLLSFCSSRVFPGSVDYEVDSGVGFPQAHSAYWHNDDVFKAIAQHWPAAGNA